MTICMEEDRPQDTYLNFELLVSNLVIHNDDSSFPALNKSTGKGNF
jgi:hypothetical protein